MIEIRVHGRGGQGAVTCSELLAVAAFKDGKYSQAFPKFGPERTGAPVEAYCRIDEKFINLRTHIYEPNYLIILDESLLKFIDVTKGLKENGTILINSPEKKTIKNFKVFNTDATKIALEILGRPVVNTAMLGAFAKVTNLLTIKSLEEALTERFSKDIAEKNIEAIKKAYEETVVE
jgi:pyruvate ferredoxin oxidoreductase gamma subunit